MTNIIIIIVICIFILYFFIRRFRRFSSLSSYSWFEILNPFNSAPLQIYKHLSPENKGSFWSVIASVIIGVISCWLGFSVQYFVYNSTQTESDKLAHYEVIDKFRPKYFDILDSCSTNVIERMTLSIGYITSEKEKLTPKDYEYFYKYKQFPKEKINSPEAQLASYILNPSNWDLILYTANKIVQVSSDIAPYLDAKTNSNLLENNGKIIISTQLFELVNDSVVFDSIKVVNECINQQVQASILQRVSYHTNWAEICSLQYLLYRDLKETDPVNRNIVLSQALNQGILQPMIQNLITIQTCFSPVDNKNDILYASILILFVSLLIGYIIMRIVIMKFFDLKSMKPNPQLSQSDYEKVIRRMNNNEKEIIQHKINDISLLNSIDKLRKDLLEKENQIEKQKSELIHITEYWENLNEELKNKIIMVQTDNEELRKTINDITESNSQK